MYSIREETCLHALYMYGVYTCTYTCMYQIHVEPYQQTKSTHVRTHVHLKQLILPATLYVHKCTFTEHLV